jgi:hypothetical protein
MTADMMCMPIAIEDIKAVPSLTIGAKTTGIKL